MAPSLALREVRLARMASMLLADSEPRTPLEVVRWFGAMQAQDAASGHWSVGVRCPGSTEPDILAAFERGDIVRTWPMRGTIHIVPGVDVRWMLALTGVRALDGAQRRREYLGLTLDDAERTCSVLGDALSGGAVLTRSQCLAALADAGIDASGQRGYHLLWFAAQSGVTCIGPQRGSDQTFVLLEDWAPQQNAPARDEALAELLLRFVRSHGPVPLKDFAGWTGLTMSDAKTALRSSAGSVVPVETEAGQMCATTELADLLGAGTMRDHPVAALPGFDEFILGYKDRTLQVPAGAMDQIVPGGNGVFRATVVADGSVVATWKRTARKDTVTVEVEPIGSWSPELANAAEEALRPFAAFLGKQLALTTI